MSPLACLIRRFAFGLWLICGAAILTMVGCGRPSELPSKAKATAHAEPAADEPGMETPDDGAAVASTATSEASTDGQPADDELLAPGDVQIPDLDTVEKRRGKGIPDGAIVLDLGGTVRTYAASAPFAVVVEEGEPVVALGQQDSKLWVSAKLFDEAGKLVCDLDKDRIKATETNAIALYPDPGTLTVYDDETKKDDAKSVLSVHFLNEGAVQLFADFYSAKGRHVVIDENGVRFGDRSLSSTGLNGTAVNLDPPADDVAQTSPAASASAGGDSAPLVVADDGPAPTSVADVGAAMTARAKAFLGALSAEELAKASMKFDDPARVDWTNIPKKERKGLAIRDMSPEQQTLCHKLLRAALSPSGYEKAVKIMSLENNLREGEKNLNTGWTRNPKEYYLTIFGDPADNGTWGWGLEGHHLSLNFVVRDDQVVSETPSFWGANPATVRTYVPGGPQESVRTLADEEQLAFDLINQLSEEQRARAIIADKAPNEYRNVGTPQPPQSAPEGLPVGEMTDAQKQTLRKLLETYAGHLAEPLAAAQLADIDAKNFDRIYFAWAGATEPGVGHYYRVQGPSFLLELVNIQSDPAGNLANHIHSVWRNLGGDFGVAISAN